MAVLLFAQTFVKVSELKFNGRPVHVLFSFWRKCEPELARKPDCQRTVHCNGAFLFSARGGGLFFWGGGGNKNIYIK